MKVSDILAGPRSELTKGGLIDHGLLAWVRRELVTFTNHQMFFFGIKNGEPMILPFVGFNNILFDEVKYYTKKDIKEVSFSNLTSTLNISFSSSDNAKFSSMRESKQDLKRIVLMFNA